jgi:hypothetical protein
MNVNPDFTVLLEGAKSRLSDLFALSRPSSGL